MNVKATFFDFGSWSSSRALSLLALLLHLCSTDCSPSTARPFYVIGHMANSLHDIKRFLEEGANAIEADIGFSRDGTPTSTYHGFPCDCWRFCFWKAAFTDFLDYIWNANVPWESESEEGDFQLRSFVALLYLDLKVSHLSDDALVRAGEKLANLVHMHLFNDEHGVGDWSRPPWILLGVPETQQVLLFKSFRQTFEKMGLRQQLCRIGYDVYIGKQDVSEVVRSLSEVNITSNIWMASGTTNCLPPDYPKLETLIESRKNGLPVDGIYHWTIDAGYRIRRTLRLGVDGIVTNNPATVLRVLDEKEFVKKYRLATTDDLPWGRRDLTYLTGR